MNEPKMDELEVSAVAHLGRSLLARERNQQARVVFSGLVAVRPGYGYAWYMLGIVHRRAGRLARAVDCLRRRLELAPQAGTPSDSHRLEINIVLAETLHEMGREAAAIDTLRSVLAKSASEETSDDLMRAQVLIERWTGG